MRSKRGRFRHDLAIGTVSVVVVLMLAGLTGPAASQTARAAAWQDLTIQTQDDNSLTFVIELPRYSIKERTIDGTVYSEIRAAGDLVPFAGEGEPDLPIYAVILAVPRGGRASIESFSSSDETVTDGIRILPVPRIEAAGEGTDRFATYIYEEAETVYSRDGRFPEQIVWLGDRGRMRNQDVVRVFISPFGYEPVRGRLRAAGRITVTVAFEGDPGLGAPPLPEEGWERVYEGTILNYEQGRRWRARRLAPLKTEAQINDRIKIAIDRTGMQTVYHDDLVAVGLPDGIPVDELYIYRDVFREGVPDTIDLVEIPIEVEDRAIDGSFTTGDRIVFYGQDFYDEFGYRGAEDMFAEENIYWLSWGAGEHRRFEGRTVWLDGEAPTKPEHFSDFVHMERDSVFCNFPPSGEFDLFYWDRYRASFPFDLPGIHPDYPCSLIVNLVNYYLVTDYPRTGTLNLLVRGCSGVMEQLTALTTYQPSMLRSRHELPPGYFCPEGNTFRIESMLSSSWFPGNTVDWFEVRYERKYEAYQDRLAFTNGGLTGELEYEITGFSDSNILLFDTTDPTSPVGLHLEPEMITEDNGTFTLRFSEFVSHETRYFAFFRSEFLDVPAEHLSMSGPPSVRDVSADYVIVSHPDFTGALSPLVTQRQNQGHTVTIVTTEEVYDDFGNGMKSDTAIKRLIKQAFVNGGTQFVLLVGDANIDRKGKLNQPPPGQVQSDIDYLPSHNRILVDKFSGNNWEIRPNDNWFIMVDDDAYPDLYLGRLPVGSNDELSAAIEKILTFENYDGEDPWKKRVTVFSDDEFGDSRAGHPHYIACYTGQDDFKEACDSVAIIAHDFTVVGLDTVKYHLERCTKDDQPEERCETSGCCTDLNTTQAFVRDNCTPDVISLLNQGGLLVNYQGHANRWQFTHETLIHDQGTRADVRELTNAGRPFIFFGFGCWISDFQWLAEPVVQDAIAEKFVLSSGGGACASFASGCSELISENRILNSYVARAFFTHLQGVDPQGNKNPARVLMGEAAMAALLRYGSADNIRSHLLLGDPAMIIDMGPPSLTVSVDDSVIDETYVFTGEVLDTLEIVGEILDEEAIVSISIDLVEGGVSTSVPADAYTTMALMDTGFAASRSYEIAYDHVPHLGHYEVRITGEDYSGKSVTRGVGIATGTAEFYADAARLAEGGQLVFGQDLRVVLTRPFVFSEEDISVVVDTTAASEFEGYAVTMKDAEGKQWEVSFMPSLEAGEHVVRADVEGFAAERTFEYVPAVIQFFADDIELSEGGYVSGGAEFAIVVTAEGGVTGDDVEVDLDGEPLTLSWAADTTSLRATFQLVDLAPGSHELTVRLFSVAVTRTFRLSTELDLFDVSVFPNPFSSDTRFFYTLTQDVSEVDLSIFTVSGRMIYEADLGPSAGYNEFVWDGRDHTGDRIANGTYLYRIVATSASGERESTGWVVKIE
jgi:hypothetical protein